MMHVQLELQGFEPFYQEYLVHWLHRCLVLLYSLLCHMVSSYETFDVFIVVKN